MGKSKTPMSGLRETVTPSVLLTAILEASATPMLIADDERRYVEVNDSACELLGYERAELLEMRIEEITPPEMRAAAPEQYELFKQAGTLSGPYKVLCKDGSEIPVYFSATANVLPGMHLSIFTQQGHMDEALDAEGLEDGPALSDRERQILTLLALGESNQTIAKQLHLAPETVRNYTRSARIKLGAKSRSHAIALAVSSRQIDLDQLPDVS